MAFRVTDADVARACTIGNRAVASRGSSRLPPRRKSKEPLSRRVKIGTSLGEKKIQATPTKQDLGTSQGFFLIFVMSTPVFFMWVSPPRPRQDSHFC